MQKGREEIEEVGKRKKWIEKVKVSDCGGGGKVAEAENRRRRKLTAQ